MFFLFVFAGENLVSESQSQRKEINQEEDGPVVRQRGLGAQRPRLRQPPDGPRVPQPHRDPRLSLSTTGYEHLAPHQEYTTTTTTTTTATNTTATATTATNTTASDCCSVDSLLDHIILYN